MKHEKIASSTLLDPNNEDVGAVLICAVRYGLGRRTYITKLISDVIIPIVPQMNNKNLCVMERDIVEQERFGYGDECDKDEWMKLLDTLKAEREQRGLEALR